MVDPDGNVIDLSCRERGFDPPCPGIGELLQVHCDGPAPASEIYVPDGYGCKVDMRLGGPDCSMTGKLVFVGGDYSEWSGGANSRKRENMKYNFETGMWSNGLGERYKGGKLVE